MSKRYQMILLSTLFSVALVACQKEDNSNKRLPVVKNNSINIEKYLDKKEPLIDVANLDLKNQSKYQCAQSICGSDYPFYHMYENNPQLVEVNRQKILNKMEKEIELTMGQAIKNEVDLNKILKNIESNPENVSDLTSDQLALINVYRLISSGHNYYDAIEKKNKNFGYGYDYIFNREKLKKINPKLSELELDALETVTTEYMTMAYSSDVDELFANYYIEAYREQYDSNHRKMEEKASEEAAIYRIYSLINEQSKRVAEKLFVPEIYWSYNFQVLDKAQRMKKLTAIEKIELVEMLQKISRVSSITNNIFALLKFSQIPYSKEQLIEDLLVNYHKNVGKAFSDKKTIKGLLNEAKDQCLITLTKSLSNTPTEQENNNAKKLLNEIQLAANELIQSEANQSLTNKLNVDFILPMSQEESLEVWKAHFASAKDSMNKLSQKVNLTDLNKSVDATTLVGLFFRYYDSPEFFERIQNVCQKSTPAFIDDAAIPTQNVFKASWVTVKHINYGLGIMAHEVGHIVSHQYPDLFKTQKDCLQNQQQSDLYTEEDFADLFSSKILLQLKDKGIITETKNMSCGLGDFHRTKPEEFSTTNAAAYDTHSSQLYRILSVASTLQQKTPQCEQYLDQYEPKAEIFRNYCSF